MISCDLYWIYGQMKPINMLLSYFRNESSDKNDGHV